MTEERTQCPTCEVRELVNGECKVCGYKAKEKAKEEKGKK